MQVCNNEPRTYLYRWWISNGLWDSRYYGAQVFYTNGNEELANVLQTSMINNLGSPLKEKRINDSIYMYKQLLIPGVLIECGFLSNDKEKSMLITDKYQDKIVDAIVDGLIKFY